jgi:signal transduction histidine kinase
VLLLCFAVVLLAAVLVSALAHRTILSTAALFLVAGFIIGEGTTGVLHLHADSPIVAQLAELALFAVLFTDGMRVGWADLRSAWRLPGRALGFGLPLTLLVTAVLAHYVAGLGWAEALLIGAILAPTDPVFAAALVGNDKVPARLRHLLNVESGVNDGLALPFVVVLLAIAAGSDDLHLGELATELAVGLAIGVLVPLAAIALERTRFFAASAAYVPLNGVAIGLLVLALGLAAGVVIARQIAGPLRRLDDAAARVAEGDLSVRARVEGSAEQRSLARTFNAMTARLERLVAGQRDFVADASHQLRTPLSGLRLRLEEAHAASRDPEVHEEVDAAMAELDRLAAIISELLVLSQAGEVDAPPEELDLDDAVRRAAARFDGAEGGRVTTVEAASGSPAFAPHADLDRVLDALIENALRYAGGEVTVVARPGGIEVLDRGPGLAADELDAVFERFHRGRAGRAGPAGTGLGLPIARELMRRWGGEVTLANRDGGGAAATVTLPFDEA